jgi:parallel beta-helix repeat protein
MDKGYGILIVSVTILVLCLVGTASATNWSVDGSGGADFTRIQDAINNSKDGDTIIVHSGVYYENVVVDKSVTLKGVDQPVVDAGGDGSAIALSADGITLVGFNATNSGISWSDVGIKLTSNNNIITGNTATNNNENGICLDDSSKNTITGNNICNNNDDGIGIGDSSENTITGNNISNNNGDGIHLFGSSENTITGNNVTNNNENGIHLYYSSNNGITGNNVCNNSGRGIYLDNSRENTITGNKVTNNKR